MNVTPKSPKGGTKCDIAVCASKIQLLSKKVCYKLSLYENFQVERKFQGASPTNDCWRHKTRFPALSRGFVILRLTVLVLYRRVTDGQTDGQTDGHTMTASTALA